MRGYLSVKTDVFSFGVLVLEIVSGRKNHDRQLSGEKVDLLSYVSYCNLCEYLLDISLFDCDNMFDTFIYLFFQLVTMFCENAFLKVIFRLTYTVVDAISRRESIGIARPQPYQMQPRRGSNVHSAGIVMLSGECRRSA